MQNDSRPPQSPKVDDGRGALFEAIRRAALAAGVELGDLPPSETVLARSSSSTRSPTTSTSPRPRPLNRTQARANVKRREAARRRRDELADEHTALRLGEYLERFGYETREVFGMHVKVTRGEPLPVMHRATHREVGAIIADPSGASGRAWFRRTRLRGFSELVRRCAFSGGRTSGSLRARRLVALGALLDGAARRTRRKGRWRYLVEGVPIALIRWMLRDPWQKPDRATWNLERRAAGVPCQTSLTGTWENGAGIVTELRRAGALYSPDNAGLPAKFLTPSGYQPNQYWLLTDVAEYGGPEVFELAELAVAHVALDEREPAGFSFRGQPP